MTKNAPSIVDPRTQILSLAVNGEIWDTLRHFVCLHPKEIRCWRCLSATGTSKKSQKAQRHVVLCSNNAVACR